MARRYLDEADAVVARRERSIDRRSLARLQIVNAVAIAGFLFASALVLRHGDSVASQMMLFTFLIWVQVSSGIAGRSGMQLRMTRERWPLIVAGGALLAGVLVVFGIAVFAQDVPLGVLLAPPLAVLVGFGSYGVAQLIVAAPDSQSATDRRMPMTRGARTGTVLVGAAIGSLIVLGGAPESVLTLVLVVLVALLMLAWFVAGQSGLSPQSVGRAWRWPHMAAFFIAAVILVALALTREGASTTHWLASLVCGAGVALLFVGASFVPGRGD